eukprot:gnl/MRDRNA2_/MRDRNA2_55866_c0_seq1.p1 gnl/MRDRNA2_/MRDRNA2_55866_c0~~gnl/MRDRNA2_/MRDRNA2_55866_c0_seq1.p1  ORF type:complete len:588 (-),score=116.81 gnl/MRDRNA2_/MRDRNA2_55866_c0_seq1:427-2190(-)
MSSQVGGMTSQGGLHEVPPDLFNKLLPDMLALEDELRQEMLLIMLDCVQGAVGLCASFCIQRMAETCGGQVPGPAHSQDRKDGIRCSTFDLHGENSSEGEGDVGGDSQRLSLEDMYGMLIADGGPAPNPPDLKHRGRSLHRWKTTPSRLGETKGVFSAALKDHRKSVRGTSDTTPCGGACSTDAATAGYSAMPQRENSSIAELAGSGSVAELAAKLHERIKASTCGEEAPCRIPWAASSRLEAKRLSVEQIPTGHVAAMKGQVFQKELHRPRSASEQPNTPTQSLNEFLKPVNDGTAKVVDKQQSQEEDLRRPSHISAPLLGDNQPDLTELSEGDNQPDLIEFKEKNPEYGQEALTTGPLPSASHLEHQEALTATPPQQRGSAEMFALADTLERRHAQLRVGEQQLEHFALVETKLRYASQPRVGEQHLDQLAQALQTHGRSSGKLKSRSIHEAPAVPARSNYARSGHVARPSGSAPIRKFSLSSLDQDGDSQRQSGLRSVAAAVSDDEASWEPSSEEDTDSENRDSSTPDQQMWIPTISGDPSQLGSRNQAHQEAYQGGSRSSDQSQASSSIRESILSVGRLFSSS